jgi:hypothetical protein
VVGGYVTSIQGLTVLLATTVRATLALESSVPRSRALAALITVGLDLTREHDFERRLGALEARPGIGRMA